MSSVIGVQKVVEGVAWAIAIMQINMMILTETVVIIFFIWFFIVFNSPLHFILI
jgi:hypothetical protein